jgi:hypothetical protein
MKKGWSGWKTPRWRNISLTDFDTIARWPLRRAISSPRIFQRLIASAMIQRRELDAGAK